MHMLFWPKTISDARALMGEFVCPGTYLSGLACSCPFLKLVLAGGSGSTATYASHHCFRDGFMLTGKNR